MTGDPYRAFLERKIKLAPARGFAVEDHEIHPKLLGHQRAIVKWAVQGGCRAVFAAFGLGKTVMELEISRLIVQRAGGLALIVAPLGVRQEFVRDGKMLGVVVKFVRRIEDCTGADVYLTNYETVRDGKLNPNAFTVCCLDEASVLRSFGSKTYQEFLTLFDHVRFRFVATATPSPNRYKELIHYGGFLGIMDTGQALTRFFQRDPSKAGNLTLYPHKQTEFFLWLNSWAVFLQRPSDIGFSDEGYVLPPLKVVFHEVAAPSDLDHVDRDGQAMLIKDPALGLKEAAREKRGSLSRRCAKLVEILNDRPGEHVLIWHDLEAEREAICEAVPEAVAVYGTMPDAEKEKAVIAFSDGRIQYLAGKPVMLGSGCNFQRFCHTAVFLGIGFKFNDFIQAVHRIQRFQQAHPVEIHIIHAESEREVLRELMEKWKRDVELRDTMTAIIKEQGLDPISMAQALTRAMGVERVEVSGPGFVVANNDCVAETRLMADNSVDLIVTSIPFSNHYEYSPSYNDFGHTDGDDHFFRQLDFLTPELMRVLKPGRVAAIHVKDRILFGSVTGKGMPTVNPFHMKTAFHYLAHGFAYMGMITVVTDVVRENNQTYRLGWSENAKDSTKMGVGSPEYVLLLRKLPTSLDKAYADDRVTKDKPDYFVDGDPRSVVPYDKDRRDVRPVPGSGYSRTRWQVDAHAMWRSSGDRTVTPEELGALPADVLSKAFTAWTLAGVYDYEAHVRIGEQIDAFSAHGLPATFMSLMPGSWRPDVWHDVNRMLTLNGEQTRKGLENHICPLQFDIVDRLIRRFSNEGDLVFDPFGGLFTVPVRAMKLGRQGRACELSPTYFLDGVKYCQAQAEKVASPGLFDVLEAEAAVREGVAA
jgi:DNA modification methylase